MELNFDVEIEPYIIEIIDNIDYYNYIRFRNFSIGIFLTKELRKVKRIVEANPHIGKKVQTNKYKYVMPTTKAVLYYEIIENSENKKSNGISGYLTNGFYKRDIFDSSAIISALQSYINYNQSYQQLARRLTK